MLSVEKIPLVMTLSTALSPGIIAARNLPRSRGSHRTTFRSFAPRLARPRTRTTSLAPARITTSVVAAIARIAPTRAASPSSRTARRAGPNTSSASDVPVARAIIPRSSARASTMRSTTSSSRVQSLARRVSRRRVTRRRVSRHSFIHSCMHSFMPDGPSLRLSDCDDDDARTQHPFMHRIGATTALGDARRALEKRASQVIDRG